MFPFDGRKEGWPSGDAACARSTLFLNAMAEMQRGDTSMWLGANSVSEVPRGFVSNTDYALILPKFSATSRAPAERPGSGLVESRLAHTAMRHVCSAFARTGAFGLHHND